MDHVCHRADAAERIEAVDRLRQVRQTQGHTVAPCDAERDKGRRRALNAPQKARVGHTAALKLIGDGVRMRLRGLRDALKERFSGIVDMLGHIAVKSKPRRFGG